MKKRSKSEPQNLEASITRLRKRLMAPFYLRGTTRGESFSTGRPLPPPKKPERGTPTDVISAYYVPPTVNLGSREWAKRLQATIHATVGRAIDRNWDQYDFTGKNMSHELLPTIMVFSQSLSAGGCPKRLTSAEAFRRAHALSVHYNPNREFTDREPPRRRLYEKALVHGKVMRTFYEYSLGDVSDLRGPVTVPYPKLFEVRMTKREYQQAIRRINERLKKHDLPPLHEIRERGLKDSELARRALAAFNQEHLMSPSTVFVRGTSETTPSDIAPYLLYLEAAPMMARKFLKKGLEWVDKNVPEM